MSSLTKSEENVGLITYVSAQGTATHFASKHIVSCTDLPNNKIAIITTGGYLTLNFDKAADKAAAMVILNEALAG